jgi:hypothetical protein
MAFQHGKVLALNLAHYNVGFAKLGPSAVSFIGSGTFIQFGSVFGILTADHVLDAILSYDRVGLVCLPVRSMQPQRLTMEKSEIDYIRLGQQPYTIDGPDLAFIWLPPQLHTTLQASVSFVNGDSQRADFRAGVRFSEQRADFVTGGVAEWTAPAEIEGGRHLVIFKALANAGQIIEDREANGLDVMRFQPIPAPDFVLPKSYEGMSGGGLWSLFVEKGDDEYFRIIHRKLVGVAYWEDPRESGLHIICQGPRSVYGKLYEMLVARWGI